MSEVVCLSNGPAAGPENLLHFAAELRAKGSGVGVQQDRVDAAQRTHPSNLISTGFHAFPPINTRLDFAAAKAAAMRCASARTVRSPSGFMR